MVDDGRAPRHRARSVSSGRSLTDDEGEHEAEPDAIFPARDARIDGHAEEALDRLGTEGAEFDAVLSDVIRPGVGGTALAMNLRRRLPVLLTSGCSHVLAEDDRHGFELLDKPHSADQLGRLLSLVTRRSVKAR